MDRLIEIVLADRRGRVVAVDERLAPLTDRLIAFVAGGGKRLRPRFLRCGWLAAGTGPEPAGLGTVAVGLELLQACALLHDDVIDRSDTRRGAPSTHRAVAGEHAAAGLLGDGDHFGVSAALLLGDLALAWADDLFLEGSLAIGPAAVAAAAPVWQAMRTEVLGGQLLDLLVTAAPEGDPGLAAADAMAVNRWKTAAYTVERPLHLGAALAGADPECVVALRRFGVDVGIAFQLRDDLLGVFGDPAVTGKPAGDDLREGKRTVLVADARAALANGGVASDPDGLAELEAGLGAAGADTERLAAIVHASGAPQRIESQIARLGESAAATLDTAGADGRPVLAEPARDELRELLRRATDRRA
ncbi:polyprenyl synthetase family protein [Nakamurella sp. YIM 132084]|uniref:Polyprenyl synthetase family protein n=1 Tax=Nakamurella leprariae TaxID=2803911 RepID=A0A938YEY0_9ACTN|nr:polyprenyl synthetase family protein [Nakamurella leprariae]